MALHLNSGHEVDAFTEFLCRRARDLRRIANSTRHELALEDVQQSAWVIAVEIERRRGAPVDFMDDDDQEVVLGWLYNEFVKYADKSIRYSVRMDEESKDDYTPSHGSLVGRLAAASLTYDPLISLTEEEPGPENYLASIGESYSEAMAYILLLIRHKGSAVALADHLQIVLRTLLARIDRAAGCARVQPTLFDGVDVIDPGFKASRQRSYLKGDQPVSFGDQMSWTF
ncbi:MAG TPA: hypothetical protein VFK45_11735 [Gammaproteobacteria bacterium]|nr:hypothetical protein [Gammaproteobacteria bacterium]